MFTLRACTAIVDVLHVFYHDFLAGGSKASHFHKVSMLLLSNRRKDSVLKRERLPPVGREELRGLPSTALRGEGRQDAGRLSNPMLHLKDQASAE